MYRVILIQILASVRFLQRLFDLCPKYQWFRHNFGSHWTWNSALAILNKIKVLRLWYQELSIGRTDYGNTKTHHLHIVLLIKSTFQIWFIELEPVTDEDSEKHRISKVLWLVRNINQWNIFQLKFFANALNELVNILSLKSWYHCI